MSWDIFVQDFPRDAKCLEEIPEDFVPAPLGKTATIIAKIREVVPFANFSNPSWGRIDGEGWSIEVNIDDSENCNGFAFHVRGGDAAAGVVAAILNHLDLRAVDSQSGDFFRPGQQAVESFQRWRSYRDQVVAGAATGVDSRSPKSRLDPRSRLRVMISTLVSRWRWNRSKK